MADRRIVIGAEGTYGTIASSFRRLQFEADDHKGKQGELSWTGIGASGGAPALSSYRADPKGATGVLKCPIYANGLGILNRAAGTSFTSAVVSGGTDAYEQVTTFGDGGPPSGRSISTVIARDRADGTIDYYPYLGGTPTQVEITIDVGGFAMIAYSMDYARNAVNTTTAPSGVSAATVVAPDLLYAYRDIDVTLTNLDDDSDNTDCVKSVKITIPLSLDVDDECITSTGIKHRPTRAGIPEPTIEIGWKYQHPRYYEAYRAGTAFALAVVMEGTTAIEDTTMPSFTVDVPAFVYDPNDPSISVSEATMQTSPGKVKSNGTDPAVTFTQVTSDTAY